MAEPQRSFDWRVPAIWTAMLSISWIAQSNVMMADEARRGNVVGLGRALVVEGTSHLVIAALLPAVYWMHRRWPVAGRPANIVAHVVALVPFSLAHTLGMAALRLLWFAAIMGEAFRFPLDWNRLSYEFPKDVVTCLMVTAGVYSFRYLLQRSPEPAPAPDPAKAPAHPERFAVRKRGGSEVVVAVADIDWIEAAGNYAILHVAGETFEIRSSLSKLEAELDPRRFVRVHKSHVVNVTRVTEVTPWVGGDWRIRLRDGAEVNLSRRYRQRFEALVPIKT
jgi:hypothetical protein